MLKKVEARFRRMRTVAFRSLLEKSVGTRWLSQSLPRRFKYVVIDGPHGDLLFDPRDFVGNRIAVEGSWNTVDTNAFLEFYRSSTMRATDGVMLEIGAHIGTQTLQFAE